jgi:hypothetical protein
MQRRHIPPCFAAQYARFTMLVTALLGFLILHASVSVGAESELPANIAVSPGNFTPLSWMCCTGFDSTSVGNEKQSCGSGPRLCDEGDFETDSRDRAGLRRDSWYFLGYQVMAIGILYAMPESVSSWSSEQKEGYSMSIWWENVTHPQMDSDDFYINYILHPYWGAAYFVRARERGYNDMESFWYSALLSSVYEFGVEALFEEPSIQDLFVTPVAGSLVGMYFMNVRDNILEREIALGHRTTKDKWLWVLTDPLGSLNRGVDKLFGRQTDLQIRPYSFVRSRDPGMLFGQAPWDDERTYGIEFRLRW